MRELTSFQVSAKPLVFYPCLLVAAACSSVAGMAVGPAPWRKKHVTQTCLCSDSLDPTGLQGQRWFEGSRATPRLSGSPTATNLLLDSTANGFTGKQPRGESANSHLLLAICLQMMNVFANAAVSVGIIMAFVQRLAEVKPRRPLEGAQTGGSPQARPPRGQVYCVEDRATS